jgi:hypothetical protein
MEEFHMPAYRIKYLQEKFKDLNQVIPDMVNIHGQTQAAALLDVSQGTISKWLRDNGYHRVTLYVKRENAKGQDHDNLR